MWSQKQNKQKQKQKTEAETEQTETARGSPNIHVVAETEQTENGKMGNIWKRDHLSNATSIARANKHSCGIFWRKRMG